MNRRARLTDELAKDAPTATKEYAIRDSLLAGFMLRVRPCGSKSWILRGQQSAPGRRIFLGSTESLSAGAARIKAHAIRSGDPPQPAVRQAATKSPRFKEFSLIYLKRRRQHLKPSTMKLTRSYLQSSILPAMGKKRLNDLTRADIACWFYAYSHRAPGGANRALAIVQDVLKKAVEWGYLEANAKGLCVGIKKNRRQPRGRLLNLEQVQQLGEALNKLEAAYPAGVNAIRLILLTGCRPNEIRTLRWCEVRGDMLQLEDTKTGPRYVQLGEPARNILNSIRRTPKQRYVFQSRRKRSRHIGQLWPIWNKARTLAELPTEIRLHDLRHTFASHAVMGGESLLMAGNLLGHRQSVSTARYAHLFDDFLLQAAEEIANEIGVWMESDA